MTPITAIRDRLLTAIDQDYNVVDMAIVVDVISQLENYAITKEALEATRLGKHINELRRKANDKQLASRAKSLVKKWRELLMPTSNSGSATPVQTASKDPKTVIAAANQRLQQHQQTQLSNGHSQPSSRLTSPAVSSSSRLSPGLVSNVVPNAGTVNISNSNQRLVVTNNHNSSSLPSSASSSPGLSRPTTPSLGSRPVSPAVPKTHVANKRLRKEEDNVDGPVSKKAKMVNGTSTKNLGVVQKNCDPGLVNGGTTTANSTSKTTKIQAASDTKKSSTPSSASITRKKKQELEREKILEEKINSAKRQASKVRTTQELVQELALRSSSSPALTKTNNTVVTNQSNSIVSETKTELMNRFFESQTTNGHSVLSPPLSDGAPSPEAGTPVQVEQDTPDTTNPISNRESVEDVLAQLPPIDVAAVLAEINSEMQDVDDDEDDDIEGLIPVKKPEPLSESVKAEMVQELHSGQHESVNGNFTHDGAFKEWHEVVSKETLSGDLLYILPYSVIE